MQGSQRPKRTVPIKEQAALLRAGDLATAAIRMMWQAFRPGLQVQMMMMKTAHRLPQSRKPPPQRLAPALSVAGSHPVLKVVRMRACQASFACNGKGHMVWMPRYKLP